MKKLIVLITVISVIAVAAIIAVSCRTNRDQTADDSAQFSSLSSALGRDWRLIQVRVGDRVTDFDRRELAREGFGNIFFLRLDNDTISGVGAPNRYSGPYSLSDEDPQGIKVEVLRSTLMAQIDHPERLREQEFYIYIQNAYKWGFENRHFVLYSKNENDAEVVLVFSL